MSAPGELGLYFFTDKMGGRLLVEVRRGPKNDGNGPLFAETFRRDNDGAYFYCDVDLLKGGEWQGPLELDYQHKPLDAMAREIFDACVANGTLPRIPFLIAALCLTLSIDAEAREPRSHSARATFQCLYQGPSTGRPRGACPGYIIDHVTPLCAGRADDPLNMQ